MLKTIGVLCVVLSASVLGFGFAGNIRRETRQLSALIDALHYMKSEILYRNIRLPELLVSLAGMPEHTVGRLFGNWGRAMTKKRASSVHECWKAALEQTSGLAISQQSRQTLSSLSLSLGQFDPDSQSRALELAVQRLSAQLQTLEQTKQARCKSYCTLGICTGLALAVILV